MIYYVTGAILILGGLAINVSINRRRFYRRGPGGLQHFDSYSKAVFTTWGERLGKLVAIALILIGIGVMLTGRSIQNELTKKTITPQNQKK
ncbi:hypothetical protein VRU48_19175 [Pedobacter sp. KR3-3]|uniref:Molybdenum ABC transporter permease n=1 Tax=Pedobacter albus TaxID=3113905 RepID=A0ABU7ICZ7_9SPHI|nr:hypothetical protein [Pedobacter sp. KR3-3]MEE1947257.1 hypothetical protein [Pedobacter sp. KR3-3]